MIDIVKENAIVRTNKQEFINIFGEEKNRYVIIGLGQLTTDGRQLILVKPLDKNVLGGQILHFLKTELEYINE